MVRLGWLIPTLILLVAAGCVNLEEVPPTGQPFVSASADKVYGEAPLQVSFTITAIPARGSIQKLVIDYGDGSSEDLTQKISNNTVSVSHTYSSIGKFKVVVTASDKNGSSNTEIQITTNDKPIISNLKTYEDPGYTKEANEFLPYDTVYIKANCFDSSGLGQVLIDWGDGSVEQSQDCESSHQYSREGDYTIKITVYDMGVFAGAPEPLSNTASTTVNIKYGIKPGNSAPNISVNAENTSGEAPLSVTIYVGVFDVDGEVKEVKVDWGDGSVDTLGSGDQIGTREKRILYKKTHTYQNIGSFRITIIAKDDKDDVQIYNISVEVSSSRPLLSVAFKDHLNQDPNGKTYDVVMTDYQDQATITANILAYDVFHYDIVAVTEIKYANNSTKISIESYTPWSDIFKITLPSPPPFFFPFPALSDYFNVNPGDIDYTPEGPYPNGITATYRITIYALKSGVVSVVSPYYCEWPSSWWWPPLSQCLEKINAIESHPSKVSASISFTVKPK